MALAAQGVQEARKQLVEIAGEANVLMDEAAASYSAAGEQPVAVVLPADEQGVAEVARLARGENIPIIAWGGGTKQDVEPVQPREGIVLGIKRLTGVEVDAANLTAAVGAGVVIDDLQKILAQDKLFMAVNPFDSAASTIGGMLAANASGPGRLLYRTARDHVLGVRVVTADGKIAKFGGKSVKDVAGYDMKKLFIGSWGTLGAITQATFKLLPLPEATATVAMTFPLLSNACSTVSGLLASFMRPSSAELLSSNALPAPCLEALQMQAGEYLLMVQFEGAVEAVERQKKELQEIAARNAVKVSTVLEGDQETMVWGHRKRVFAKMPSEPSVLIKGSVLLKRVFDFASGLANLQQQGLEVAIASHAGNGIVYGMITAADGQAGKLVEAADRMQQLGGDCGGFALVLKAPREVVGKMRLWPPRSDYGVMKGIKAQLDPANLWNPARIPGGSN